MTIDFERDQQDAMKKTTNIQSLADQVEKVVAWELSEQIRLQKTEDFKEGIASSLERRQPNFSRK